MDSYEQTYIAATQKVNEINAELKVLWDKGDFKRRSQIIWSQWRNATQKKNRAEKKLLAHIKTFA